MICKKAANKYLYLNIFSSKYILFMFLKKGASLHIKKLTYKHLYLKSPPGILTNFIYFIAIREKNSLQRMHISSKRPYEHKKNLSVRFKNFKTYNFFTNYLICQIL